MKDTEYDKIGRIFCKQHHRDYCHECCFDFRDQNRMIEEDKGLRQKRSPVEETAEMWAVCAHSLRGMERMSPRPSQEVFDQNRQFMKEFEEKLQIFAQEGHNIETAMQKAMEKQMASDLERQAMMQEFRRRNPHQHQFELGGTETQQIYEKVAQAPQSSSDLSDQYTCTFCGTTRDEKLKICARCKVAAYCSRECQASHWKAHKKECKPRESEPPGKSLTWEEVEAHGGLPVTDETLEVKVMLNEGLVRQVFQCKDRIGVIRRIAVYTNSRQIPGLRVGSTLLWKNPRYHYFMDGSSGGRIEDEDLPNITVKN